MARYESKAQFKLDYQVPVDHHDYSVPYSGFSTQDAIAQRHRCSLLRSPRRERVQFHGLVHALPTQKRAELARTGQRDALRTNDGATLSYRDRERHMVRECVACAGSERGRRTLRENRLMVTWSTLRSSSESAGPV